MNKKIIISLLFFIILFSGCEDTSTETSIDEDSMTFEVEVPKNTIEGDTVHIYPLTLEHYKMQQVDDFTYKITLTKEQIQPEDFNVYYRYSRNGYDYSTAEYLEPDTNDYFWTQRGRTTTFSPGKVQQDVVGRWRWFPEEGLPIRTTPIEPAGNFLPRINNQEFRSGQIIEDLYNDAFHDFFDSTAEHMKKMGYTWVEIDPPWQWTEENGLPKVVNLHQENPNYPDDETLLEEIKAFKERGIKVMLGPQLCCTELSTEDRSTEWWDSYFSETTRFLVHFAQLAEEADIDSLHYALGHEYWEYDYAERWSQVFKEIRKYFSGEIGEMIWNFGEEPGAIIPDADFITWGDELDYFYIAVDTPISRKESPTDDELKAGAAIMLDGVKQLYDRYHKPIFVRTTYFGVKETWRGNSFYDISSVPWVGSEEKELEESIYEYKPEDQARVVNAYFQAIAERPFIIGYAQFGYEHWENPLVPGLSVRGKPAEDLWRKWNDFISY